MVTVAPRRARGFTMIELLWTMLILAILAGIAAPSVQEMMARQRLRTGTSDVINALLRARSSAVKLERNVTLRPAVAGTNWQGGWEITHPDTAQPAIYIQSPLKAVTVTGPASVVYQFSGRVAGSSSAQWQISTAGTDQVRCVELELNGLPSQKPTACS